MSVHATGPAPASAGAVTRKPWTVPMLRAAKQDGRRMAMLTCYDASFARAVDAAGIDLVLIGDSLGMVMQGHASTLPVTVADITYHTACVARTLRYALLVADMPFQADATPERALDAATAFLQAGAAMVKIEGGGPKLDVIRYLVEREIPVCSHLGLTPQAVLRMGGYKVQGRDDATAAVLREQARQGVGAGPGCDGQVLVLHDMLGMDSGHRRPKFVKDFLAEGGSITGAMRAYAEAVRDGSFPGVEHSYS